MQSLMQDIPLTTNWIFDRGVQYFGTKTVTTVTATGRQTQSYADVAEETRRLAAAIDSLGISPGGRVGTFAWNTARHLGLYFAIPGTGRIMHTVNIRYFAEQVIYTVDHAEDEAIFVDRSLLPLLGQYLPSLHGVKHVIVMDDGATTEIPDDPRILDYDELLASVEPIDFSDRVSDERQGAALCYTTGTTGNPKGVLYSHRSTWLHSNACLTTSVFALTEADRILPVVPMFHANAWGIPYAAFLAGSALVMPGADLSPGSLITLMESEKVTIAAGVPTIWMGMVPLLPDHDLSRLRTIICGGSAVPKALSEAWRATIGLPITQAWGMTELSPLGSVCIMRSEFDDLPEDERADIRATAGIAPPGVELRIVDADTRQPLPWDDAASGELECRGPWIAKQYFKTDEPGEQFSPDGWLRTGDVASISPLGYLRLVDRTKDLIKSGGEWISSVDLENTIMGHPAVAEAAVIAVPHPKWSERPLACVVVKPGESVTKEELLAFLAERLTKWQLPDDIVFIDEVPKTSVGKFSKKTLRDRFGDHALPSV
ncbi:long-chain fatty acid--CoA ligase [Jatrophihabitans sp.]|uniref:long-chain fatty acid--CoA ligase n=1 Tax=Jatrophihabitans sp. TaxID=1932789 RepID=UPI0030C68955|nr:Long-chain-fatty-acid--CoA ligase [Jatrophihabitans sp.]